MAIIKAYNEYLERYSLGLLKDKLIPVYTIDSNRITYEKMNNFMYGNNEIYGKIDTIGTACGNLDFRTINKSIEELIGNNESYIFWYTDNGVYINDKYKIFKCFNEASIPFENFFAFSNRNLSNNYVIYLLVFDNNNRYISSGIGVDIDVMAALDKAVKEVRVLLWENTNNERSFLYNLDNLMHQKIYEFILQKVDTLNSAKLSDFELEDSSLKKLIFEDFYNLKITTINIRKGHNVVKCVSEQLINCLPTLSNLKTCQNKEIIKRYKTKYDFDYILF